MIVKPIDAMDVPISTVTAANDFGLDLFRRMYSSDTQGNWVTSPASLWFVMSMAIAGARGQTLNEIRTAMRLPEDYSLIDLGRLRQAEEPLKADGTVQIANLLVAHSTYELLPTFVSYCRDVMAAESWNLDFGDPKTVAGINAWISQVTRGKITDLLQGLSPNDRIALINAVYLKAQWAEKFDDGEADWFNGPTGRTQCYMMSKKERLRYARHDGYQATKIPYRDGKLSMMILLPDVNVPLDGLLARMSASDIQTLLQASLSIEVELEMPRFKIERTMGADMMNALRTMGMQSAFTGTADFSAMSGRADLFVGQVLQRAVIEVDELGTEAAAATMMTLGIKSIAPKLDVARMRLDRPFFYAIVDEQTNLVLFNGVVNRP